MLATSISLQTSYRHSSFYPIVAKAQRCRAVLASQFRDHREMVITIHGLTRTIFVASFKVRPITRFVAARSRGHAGSANATLGELRLCYGLYWCCCKIHDALLQNTVLKRRGRWPGAGTLHDTKYLCEPGAPPNAILSFRRSGPLKTHLFLRWLAYANRR